MTVTPWTFNEGTLQMAKSNMNVEPIPRKWRYIYLDQIWYIRFGIQGSILLCATEMGFWKC